MPNGEELNEQLEFEERIKDMPSEDRTIFIAKQAYALTNKFGSIERKVDALDVKFDNFNGVGISKKTSAVSGGITGGIIAVAIALIEYFRGR